VKIDTGTHGGLDAIAALARGAERDGYHGIFTAEAQHDPFLPLVLAANCTDRVEVGTAIAVAFARNPMTLANLSYDLQRFSRGRFILGLGSQIRPHIERRFSMPWSQPAARMRELIVAIRAIWAAWQDGTPLDFRGDYYTHTLMPPFFVPGPNPYGYAKIFGAAVGPYMTEAMGEVADGLLVHAFTTESYLRAATLPALARGLKRAGRQRADIEVSMPPLVVTGPTEDAMRAASLAVRKQLAFYGSTPAYRPVLDHHGWGEAQTELNRLSKLGRWDAMADVIDDAMLDALAIVAEPSEVASRILQRFAGLADRVNLYTPYELDDAILRSVVAELRGATEPAAQPIPDSRA
jgi:probable F420-dependent oxidoreductase